MACAPSEDSDQPGHPTSLFSSLNAQREAKDQMFLHADSEDSDQTDLSFRWAHRSFCWFCRAVSHFHRVKSDVITLIK